MPRGRAERPSRLFESRCAAHSIRVSPSRCPPPGKLHFPRSGACDASRRAEEALSAPAEAGARTRPRQFSQPRHLPLTFARRAIRTSSSGSPSRDEGPGRRMTTPTPTRTLSGNSLPFPPVDAPAVGCAEPLVDATAVEPWMPAAPGTSAGAGCRRQQLPAEDRPAGGCLLAADESAGKSGGRSRPGPESRCTRPEWQLVRGAPRWHPRDCTIAGFGAVRTQPLAPAASSERTAAAARRMLLTS